MTTAGADRRAADERVPRDRFETILLLVVWVLPVLVAAGFLVAVDLAWFAFALVAIEAVVRLIVAVVRRRPQRSAGPSRRPRSRRAVRPAWQGRAGDRHPQRRREAPARPGR